jgi:crotonobetaine/carnitine-CoA ligase
MTDERDRTLPELVALTASQAPERPFLQAVDGPGTTYGETQDRALRWAGALRALGVRSGDRVVTILDNCIEGPTAWLALAHLGAVDVAISPLYRGQLLAHVLRLADARVAIVEPEVVASLAAIEGDTGLHTVIVRGESVADTLDAGTPIETGVPPAPHDIACVVFTSGTTGPSKGALLPWRSIAVGATTLTGELGEDDVIYHTSPANHAIARVHTFAAAYVGGGIVLKRGFRTQDYWPDIDRYGCTYANLVGAMPHFVMSQSARDDDAAHPLDKVTMSPIHPQLDTLMRRFGIRRVSSAFGMTECLAPVRTGWEGITDPRSCGRTSPGWPGFELRLVDENDEEVPVGEVGEMLIRTQAPWSMAVGYLGMPTETAAAWRNGWFHTGDGFRRDSEGNFYFVDRIKDSIRRRGENVSSFEVEMEVIAHPDVAECAAIGVPASDAEEEIKVFVVPANGTLDPEDLIRFLAERMTRYMIPRYVEIVDALPKTPTQRVKKVELRARTSGVVWDRTESGIEIARR